MKITVKVKPGSRVNSVETSDDGSYIVRVKSPAKEGRANRAVIEALGEYFGRPKSAFIIRAGQTNKLKVIEVS
jgi:uncharacterized protein (TIGR00251 family)